MQSWDDISVNEAIELYYEKHHALREGDLLKLRELKNKCPDIFDKVKDAQISKMIEYAKQFAKTERYQELRRMKVKEKLSIIESEKMK